uniref:Cytochrome b5 heme-binding domain-containing protein n=1 Tax=Ornithorhynchus anatinus TaxID=9258 RepID=A0A6I8N6K3_ORNAN
MQPAENQARRICRLQQKQNPKSHPEFSPTHQGQGGLQQEANGKPLSKFSWQEVQKHNTPTDRWLVINRKVYDITSWAERHPGGNRVISHYAGEDATDVFWAMHIDQNLVQKYLKPLLIGQLSPEEPSFEKHKNAQLVEDFRALRKTAEDMKLFDAHPLFFSLHLSQILLLEALAWLIVLIYGNGWIHTLLISFILTISQAQSSFLQHDIGHLSIFKKSGWNHLFHKFVMGHLKGMSPNWWNHRHFQHHAKPNIYPKDPDIDMGPLFLLGEAQPIKVGFRVGLPLLMPGYFNIQSMQVMYLRKDWVDIVWAISFYIRYFITFSPYYGIIGTILLIFFVKLLESPWIAYVTQMSHIPMKMSYETNQDWLSTQVIATCNIQQSFFNDWFTGHLNFQIEHHLFPTMPRHNYHKIAPLVKSLCSKYGFSYVNKPLLTAFADIARSFKKSGYLWAQAYYQT